jgi:hypothetical protein
MLFESSKSAGTVKKLIVHVKKTNKIIANDDRFDERYHTPVGFLWLDQVDRRGGG